MKLSVVIPVYNEAKNIRSVIRSVQQVLKRVKVSHEFIVVNDGSSDRTSEVLKKENIRLIEHPHNKGYGASLKTGAREAKGEYILYLDGDGQHDARDILKFMKHLGDYDMVVGARQKQTSLVRAPAKIAIGLFASFLAEYKIPDLNSGFRLIKRDVILGFIHLLPNTFSFTTTITLASIKGGKTVKYIPINIRARKGGKSTMHPIKDTIRFVMLIMRMTMLFSPLRVFLPVSFLLFIAGLALAIYELVTYFNIGSASVMLLISSILIFFFGLMADQLSMLRRQEL